MQLDVSSQRRYCKRRYESKQADIRFLFLLFALCHRGNSVRHLQRRPKIGTFHLKLRAAVSRSVRWMKTETKQKQKLVHGKQPRPVYPADEGGRLWKAERRTAVVAVAGGGIRPPTMGDGIRARSQLSATLHNVCKRVHTFTHVTADVNGKQKEKAPQSFQYEAKES